jgi:hypothetical protein
MDNSHSNTIPAQNAGRLQRFLWWLSAADAHLLKHPSHEGNRFAIVGITVFCTWCFATLAWCYFFSTVVAQSWQAILLGLVMGFIILSTDRALIKTIVKSSAKKWLPLLFRLLLAAVIGLFMAQPALHFLFKKEIALQIAEDNIQKQQQQQTAITTMFQQKINEINTRKKSLEQAANISYSELQSARNNYIAETDGSGGSGKVGVKEVALAKLKEYQKLDSAYNLLQKKQLPEIEQLNREYNVIQAEKNRLLNGYSQLFNNGFLIQAEALQNLLRQHPALRLRYILLVVLLLLIELLPLITKMMMPTGAYEQAIATERQLALLTITHSFQQNEKLIQFQHAKQAELNEQLLANFFDSYEQKGTEMVNNRINEKTKGSTPIKGKDLLALVKSDILV